MAQQRILSVEFLGPDLQKDLEEMAEEVFGENAIKKQNNIINKAMKAGAEAFRRMAIIAMKKNTGISAIAQRVQRIRRTGGWTVVSARRRDLQDSYPDQDIVGAKGYYPAVREAEDDRTKGAFKANEQALRNLVVSHIRARIDKEVKKYIRKQKRMPL